MKRLSILFLLALLACSERQKFSDQTLIKINDLKDRRNSDSLFMVYLRSENPVYRREAALAFGSVQDTLASLALGNVLLEDADAEVRRNAAFALGQTGGYQAVNALIPALEDKERIVVREVLEALGKAVTSKDMTIIAGFQSTDTLLQSGQAWALYRLALRRMTDSLTTKTAARFLEPGNVYQARLGAAHYFGRAASVTGKAFEEQLIETSLHDASPEVRMAAASGIKHVNVKRALPVLITLATSDSDYRVRINAVRGFSNFIDSAQAKVQIISSFSDKSEMVQVTASEIVRRSADKFTSDQIRRAIGSVSSIRVKANLLGALLKLTPDDNTIREIEKGIAEEGIYGKAALLSALGEARPPVNRKAFEILSVEIVNASTEKVILTSSAAAMGSLNKNSGKELPAAEFLEVYKKGIANGDPGVIGIICSSLTDESLPYRELIKDPGFLYEAKSGLKLPKDIESLEPLERAIAYLEGKKAPQSKRNAFNHPIDWKAVSNIAKDQKAEIITAKGTIVIQLLVEEAPGSVLNFVDLVNKKYFDERFFHRVVPNFVAQDGCNRGDGFGSEDYSIRSEFSSRRYTTGSVGMASAGKDTEGTQWFITHSPTPHLDGRYTIFAEVKSGMEVVHQLDVGDRILSVKLKQ